MMGRLKSGVRATNSTTIAGPEIQREPVDRCPEDRADDERYQAAQHDRQQRRDNGRAPAQQDAGRDETESRRGGDEHGLEHLAELRYAEVEFDLEHRQADEDAAEAEVLNELDADAVGRSVIAHRLEALVVEHDRRQRGEAGAADHHQMGRPPQRDVLAEDAVPDVVEWEARECVEAAPGHQDAADGCVPGAGDPHGRRPRLVVRQHAGQAAGDEEKEQSEQDEVVRGVGQRSRVTALADVQADVPDEPEQRADQGRDEQCQRQRHPRWPLELASGPLGEVVQPGDAALPMQIADPQEPHGDDEGHRRHSDYLVERGATALAALCDQRNRL